MPPTNEQFAELLKNQQKIMQDLTETTTVVRRHVVEQSGINERVERLVSDLDKRARQTEQQVVRIEEKLVDDPVAHEDFKRLEGKVDLQGEEIKRLSITAAKWAGSVAAIVSLVGWFIKGLFGLGAS